MGGHIRGGLKAQNWGAGVCSGLRVPSLVPSGTLGFLNPSGLASVVLKHSNQVLPGVCDPGGAQAENPQTGMASL